MRRVLCLAMVAGCATTGGSHGPLLLPYVLEDANDAHEPLVVELGATWCKPCHMFTEKVLPDPRVQEALHGIHFVRYDIDTPAGHDAMRRIGNRGVPAVVGIDPEGTVRVFKEGTEDNADNFLEFLREVHAHLDRKN